MVEADESDGTFLELGARDAWSPTSSPTTSTTTAASTALDAAFDRFVARRAGVRVVGVRRRPGGAALGRPDRRRARTGRRRTPTARIDDVDADGRGSRLHRRAPAAPALGELRRCPCRVSTTPATRWPRRRWPSSWARRSTPPARALARFAGVARRFEYRGEADGVTLRRRLRPPADRGRPPRSTRRGDGGWRRVVVVFQPHRYSRTAALWPSVRRRLRRRRRGRRHRRVPGGRGAPARGDRQAGRRRRARRPPPARTSPTCPRRAELRRLRARDAASRRPVPDPRRRRPHVAARRGHGRARPPR